MQLLKDYVLLVEIIKFSTSSSSSIHRRYKNSLKLGKLSFVKKIDLTEEDRKNLDKFTDLTNLYPMGELSTLVGRNRDHFSHMMNPTKDIGVKPKPIKIIKIGKKYNMIVLTKDFVINVEKGLTPFAIDTNKERDYENAYKDFIVIDFYEMKIGFY